MQKGDNAALLETKKKEMEVKRAAAASKGAKVFYKVTVKVRCSQCLQYSVRHNVQQEKLNVVCNNGRWFASGSKLLLLEAPHMTECECLTMQTTMMLICSLPTTRPCALTLRKELSEAVRCHRLLEHCAIQSLPPSGTWNQACWLSQACELLLLFLLLCMVLC